MKKLSTSLLGLVCCLMLTADADAFGKKTRRTKAKPGATATQANAKSTEVNVFLGPDTEVKLLLRALSDRLNKPLIMNKAVRLDGVKAGIIMPRGMKVPPERLIDLINVVLEKEGLAVAVSDTVIRVVPAADAGRTPRHIQFDGKIPSNDTWVTRTYRLKNNSPRQIKLVLEKMGSKQMKVLLVPGTELLVIHELESNMAEIEKAIKILDRKPVAYSLELVSLKHADSKDVSSQLRPFVSSLKNRLARMKRIGESPSANADARTNSIVLYGTAEQRIYFRKIIKTLDQAAPGVNSTIHIYKVRNGSAEELAKVLESLFTKKAAAASKSKKSPVSAGKTEGAPSIVAVKDQNALIVVAGRKQFEELLRILEDLDALRPQVMIEASIVEMTLEKAEAFGVELATAEVPGVNESVGFGGTAFGLTQPSGDGLGRIPTASAGLIAGVWKEGFDKIPIILKASRNDSDVNLLSVPRLMTNDNEKAEFKNLERIPFQTTNLNTDGNVTNQTFGGYNDAGTSLIITPHISEDDYLRLEIELSVDAFSPLAGSSQPAITSRAAKSVVTVPDRSTVVLSGMTRVSKTKREQGIPFISKVPLIGALFRSSQWDNSNINLYIFIKPRIMRTLDQVKKHGRNALEESEAINLNKDSVREELDGDDDASHQVTPEEKSIRPVNGAGDVKVTEPVEIAEIKSHAKPTSEFRMSQVAARKKALRLIEKETSPRSRRPLGTPPTMALPVVAPTPSVDSSRRR